MDSTEQQGDRVRFFDAAEVAAEASMRGEDPLQTVLTQAIGAASACWDNLAGAGVFQDQHASAIVDQLEQWVRGWQWVEPLEDGQRLVLALTGSAAIDPEHLIQLRSLLDGPHPFLVVSNDIKAYVVATEGQVDTVLEQNGGGQ